MNLRLLSGSALTACLMLFTSLGAAQDSKDKKKGPADPPRTAQYMNQLRLVFDTWDVNKDGYLDKKELAVAFRGKGSLPYDHAETKKKEKSEKDEDKDKSDKDKSSSQSSDKDKDKSKDKSSKTPDYSKIPDYVFLKQLDQDMDDQVSREEFMAWARDYAVQLRDQADLALAAQKTQLELNKLAKNAKNRATVEAKLKKQQQDLNRLQNKIKQYERVQAATRK